MLNRALLADMIGDAYRIIEAEDGKQAVAALQKEGAGISLVLLDYVMPQMNGFDVLEVMNKNGWIKDIPVIMVSAESDAAYIERAYELGVTDFINRPYDVNIVRRRVMNTLMLYQKQRTLMGMVADQVYEREKSNNLMVYILSHIVEFRNGESGMHVLNVQAMTEMILTQLMRLTDQVPADHRGHLAHHDGLQSARHRQDRHPRGDPEQAGPFHRRRVRHHEDPLRRGLRYAGRPGAVQGREAGEGRAGHLPLAP